MFFYILSIFWCFFSFIFKRLRTSSRWYLLTMSMLCVFLCFGYMTGSDWRAMNQCMIMLVLTIFFMTIIGNLDIIYGCYYSKCFI